jgi:hypothetical protein
VSEPQTHDYRYEQRRLGWDLSFTPVDGGLRLRAHGWGGGLNVGDYLLLSNPTGGDTRYKILADLRYERDPADMWWATLVFAPRES